MATTGSKPKKPAIQLDWFNISYRTLFTSGFMALVVVGAGSYYAYWRLVYQGSPKAEARSAINDAEEALNRAGPVAQQDATTDLKQAAQRLLSEARRQYDASNYQDARKAAVESKLNSEKAISVSRGESAREVQFYRIEGDVKVKRVRELIWIDAEAGMALATGDQIKTSSRASAQIIYFNGTITTIKPGSLLEIKDLYDNPATRVQKVREQLREGRITASTQEPAAEGSVHEVETMNSVAKSSHRTDFEIGYDTEREQTHVEVHTGQATLSPTGGDEVEISASQQVEVDREARVSDVKDVPRSPLLMAPMDQKIYLLKESDLPTVNLEWETVPGARSYRLQIASQSLFADPIVDLKDLRTTAASLPSVKEGGYYWRVAAVYASGTASPYSQPRKFKVVPGRIGQTEDDEPPPLSVDDFLVFASQVIVRGRTEPGALLSVAGAKVDVADDGSFTTVVSLRSEGINRVRFVAQDMAGNETRIERTATVDSY